MNRACLQLMNPDYDPYHQHPTNLVLHILAVPFFVIGTLLMLWALVLGHWLSAAGFFVLPALSLAVQGVGHKMEVRPPEPFSGPANFLARVFAEQFFRFWVFVFSGRWLHVVGDKSMSEKLKQ